MNHEKNMKEKRMLRGKLKTPHKQFFPQMKTPYIILAMSPYIWKNKLLKD